MLTELVKEPEKKNLGGRPRLIKDNVKDNVKDNNENYRKTDSIKPYTSAEIASLTKEAVSDAEGLIEVFFEKKFANLSVGSGNGERLTEWERNTLLMGLGLKMKPSNLLNTLNEERAKEGRPLIEPRLIRGYQKRYAELIDEIWITVFTRLADVYSFADKAYRIARLNDLAEAVHPRLLISVRNEEWTKELASQGSFFLNLMRIINQEMGNLTVKDMLNSPHVPKDEPDELSSEEVKKALDEIINERFSAQLPETISTKIDYTDYTNCAFSEKINEDILCWSESASNHMAGDTCSVQTGKVKQCQYFLNKTLIDNKEFLGNCRARSNTVQDIAHICGCKIYDDETKQKVIFYLRKNDISLHHMKVDDITDNVEDGQSEITAEGGEATGEVDSSGLQTLPSGQVED